MRPLAAVGWLVEDSWLKRCILAAQLGTAPLWARDHFQIVAVEVWKTDPASTVVMIDLARAATPRVGPVLKTLLTNAAEDGIEISLGNQESVVLRLNRSPSSRVGVRFCSANALMKDVWTR